MADGFSKLKPNAALIDRYVRTLNTIGDMIVTIKTT
jgi:hypothetical protein